MIFFLFLCSFANDFLVQYHKGIAIKRAYKEGAYAVDIPVQFPPKLDLYTISTFVNHSWKDKPLPQNKKDYRSNAVKQLQVITNAANGQLYNGDALEKAAQLSALFQIAPNSQGKYISRYEKLMEPWELLLFTVKEEGMDSIPTRDSFSAAVSVLMTVQNGKLIRYRTEKSESGSIYGVFIPKERKKGFGIPTKSGTILPMSSDLDLSLSKSVEYLTLEQALDLAYGQKVTPENGPVVLETPPEDTETIPDLPPETAPQKRPQRSVFLVRNATEGFAWTWIILISGSVLYLLILNKRRRDRTIAKAIEARKEKERQQNF